MLIPLTDRLQDRHGPRHVPAADLRLLRACGSRACPFPAPALGALATLLLPLHGGELHVGRQHPLDARRRVLVLARPGAHGPLLRHAARGRSTPAAVVRGTGCSVALIGMSHGYTLLWAGLCSLVELIATRGWWRRVGALVGRARPRHPADGASGSSRCSATRRGPRPTTTSGSSRTWQRGAAADPLAARGRRGRAPRC